MTSSIEVVSRRGDRWRQRLAQVIEQDPLILSKPSRAAVRRFDDAPRIVYLGVGLCTRDSLSQGLPVDLLGMILPAEAIRRAVAASQIVVLVADTHATTNNLPLGQVERRARRTVGAVARIARRLGLTRLVVLRASALDRETEFVRTLSTVTGAAQCTGGRDYHPYVLRQVADVAYFAERFGPVVKVGWAMSSKPLPSTTLDEAAFDRLVEPLTGARAAYIYCSPGRALDDGRRRVPPYIVHDPARRVLLRHDEDVAGKLARAAACVSPGTLRAVRNHLRRLTASYVRVLEPVRGASVEDRVQAILGRIFQPRWPPHPPD